MNEYKLATTIEDKMYFLQHHNKNLTLQQECAIDDLCDYIKQLEEDKKQSKQIILSYLKDNRIQTTIRNLKIIKNSINKKIFSRK